MSYRQCPNCLRWFAGAAAFKPGDVRCIHCPPVDPDNPLLGAWSTGPTKTVDKTVPSMPEYPKKEFSK